jgi:predicted dehydrogenase
MKKINLLILGYSKFVQKRLLKSIKNSKKIQYKICSKSKKGKGIYFSDYNKALSSNADMVYISLSNHLHFKYAKIALLKGMHVIVDKPITPTLKQTKELIKIAKRKNLLISESTLFNYHKVFDKINKLLGGKNKLKFIQSNFNIPQVKTLKQINLTRSDCFMDMSPYAASLVRLYLGSKIDKLNFYKENFLNSKSIKSFYIFTTNNKTKYFGNFSIGNEYLSQIIFSSGQKIIYLNFQAFALPSNKKIKIILKKDNKYKNIFINKDDSINNYFNKILLSIKNKKFSKFYNLILDDAKMRNIMIKGKK